MANINELLGGVSIANPAFNPKTKAGRLQPPTIQTNNPADNEFNAYAKGFGRNLLGMQYNLNEFAGDNFAKYNVFAGPQSTREELERERAKNQGALEQLGNSLVQTFGSEIALGVVKGVADLADIAFEQNKKIYAAATGQEYHNDFTNPVSQQMEEWQEELRNNFAIYQEDPNAQLDLTSWAYLMNRMPTVASTVSLMVPGMGASKVLSALGKLGKATKAGAFLSKGYNKALKIANKAGNKYGLDGLKNTYALDRSIRASADQVSTAFFMRTAENNMEAREAYKTTLDETKALLENLTPKQREEFNKRNPEYEGKDDDYIAADLAGEAGANVFAKNYPLMFFDVIQLKALKDLWKPIHNTSLTGGLARAQRESIEALAPKVAEKTGAAAVSNTVKNKIKDNFGRYNTVAVSELSEGVEEAYQYVVGEQSREDAIKKIRPDFEKRNLSDFLSEGELWDSAFWGWMGGITFQAIGSGVGKLSKKLRDKNELTEEIIAKREIDNRKTRLDKLINTLNDLNEGIPVNMDVHDMRNYDPITGELKNKLSDEEIAVEKEKVIDSYISEMAIDAINSGTLDLLKEYMKNPIIAKHIQEQSKSNEDVALAINNKINERLNKVEGIYSKHAYRLQQLNLEDPFVRNKVAETNTRLELIADSYKQELEALDAQINKEYADSNITRGADIEEYIKKLVVNNTVIELKKQIDELTAKINTKGAIKDSADLINLKKYNKQLNELYKIIDPSFENDESAYLASIQEAMTDNTMDAAIKGNKALVDKIARKVILQNDINNINKKVANTDSDYNKQYHETSKNFDAIRNDKISKAQIAIAGLMNKYNEDDVYNYVVNGGEISNISEEDKNTLDEAKTVLDITDKEEDLTYIKFLDKAKKEIKDKKEKDKKVVVTTNGKNKVVEKENPTKEVIPETDVEEDTSKEDTTDDEVSETSPIKDELPSEPAPEPTTPKPETSSVTPPVTDPMDPTSEPSVAPAASSSPTVDEATASGMTDEEVSTMEKDEADFIAREEAFMKEMAAVANVNDVINTNVKNELSKGIDYFLNVDNQETIFNNIATAVSDAGFDVDENRKRINDSINVIKRIVNIKASGVSKNSFIEGVDNDNENVQKEFEKLIEAYTKDRKATTVTTKGVTKTYIDIVDLFDYLIREDGIVNPEYMYLFYATIRKLVYANSNKYIFKNIRGFYNKTADDILKAIIARDITETIEDSDLRIGLEVNELTTVNNINTYNKIFSELKEGEQLELRAFYNPNTKVKSVGIFKNGVRLGILTCGSQDVNGTGYHISSYGVSYKIDSNNNNYTNDVFDIVYDKLFDAENNTYSDLFVLIQQYNNTPNDENYKEIANNETFKEIVRQIQDTTSNKNLKPEQLLRALRNILNYTAESSEPIKYVMSYNNWKKKQYDNINRSNEIHNELRNNLGKTYTIDKINKGEFLFNVGDENVSPYVPLNAMSVDGIGDDFSGTNDKVQLGVVNHTNGKGNVVTISGGESYSEETGFRNAGAVFVRIDNGNFTPKYLRAHRAVLNTKAIDDTDPHKAITDDLKAELYKIFTKRLYGNIDYDEFKERMKGLFGNEGYQLFDGIQFIENSTTNNDGFALVEGGRIVFSTYRKKHNSNNISNAISIGSGDARRILNYDTITENKHITTINDKTLKENIDKLIDSVIENIIFSQPYRFFDSLNKNFGDKKLSRYVRTENGEFIVTLNDKEKRYGDYFDYVVKNNAYTVNARKDKNTNSNYVDVTYTSDDKGRLYIKHNGAISIKTVDINEGATAKKARNAQDIKEDLLKVKADRKDTNKGRSYLRALGVDEATLDKLDNLGMMPQNVHYQANLEGYGITSVKDGKVSIKIGDNFVNAASANPKSEGVRTLLHERIHQALLDPNTGISIKEYYDELEVIKNKFTDYLESIKTTFPKTYNDLIIFTYGEEFLSKLSPSARKRYEGNRELILEEFFIESLTNNRLTKVLNSIDSGEINTIDNTNKTLLQKIIDVLIDLLHGAINIDEKSLLAKEYNIFTKLTDDDSNSSVPEDNGISTDKSITEEPVDNKDDSNNETPESSPVEDRIPIVEEDEMAKIARERNSSTYSSGYKRYLVANDESNKQTLTTEEATNNMDLDDLLSTISGVEDNNPVNKFAKIQDILVDTDVMTDAEIDAFLESGLINFYC